VRAREILTLLDVQREFETTKDYHTRLRQYNDLLPELRDISKREHAVSLEIAAERYKPDEAYFHVTVSKEGLLEPAVGRLAMPLSKARSAKSQLREAWATVRVKVVPATREAIPYPKDISVRFEDRMWPVEFPSAWVAGYTLAQVANGGIASSPDGSVLALAVEQGIALSSTATGERVGWLRPGSILPPQPVQYVTHGAFIAFSPEGSHIVEGPNNALRVWRVADRAYVHRVPVDSGYVDLSMHPNGDHLAVALYSEDGMDGKVRVWSISREQVIREFIAQGHRISSVQYVNDGRQLLTGGNRMDGQVHLWDTSSGEKIRTLIQNAPQPDGTPAGVWISEYVPSRSLASIHLWPDQMSWWNTDTWSEVARGIRSEGVGVTQDGLSEFALSRSGSVRVRHPLSDTQYQVLDGPLGSAVGRRSFACDPHGNWFALALTDKLFSAGVVKAYWRVGVDLPDIPIVPRLTDDAVEDGAPASMPVVASLQSDIFVVLEPALTDSGRPNARIAFLSDRAGSRDIFVMDSDGSNVQQLTDHAAADGLPSWSPDGTQIAFQSDRAGNPEVHVMDSDGSNVRNLSNRARSTEAHAAWLPNGEQIAFYSDRDGNYDIYVMDLDGGNIRRFTNHPAADTWPSWSPDGDKVAFVSERRGSRDIYVIGTDGYDLRQVTNSPSHDDGWSWSPDGSQIAFHSGRDGNNEVYVIGVDGANERRLTDHPAQDELPSWSPDGRHIAFASDRSGTWDIYLMDTDGTNLRRTTTGPGNDTEPSWSPLLSTAAPTVAIAAPPQSPTTVMASAIQLRATAKRVGTKPITWTKITVNGKALPDGKGQKTLTVEAAAPKEVAIEEDVALVPGRNEITVTAGTATTESDPATVVVIYEPPQLMPTGPKPDLYVLAVGVAEYANPQFNLRYPDDDARDFAAACEQQEGQFYGQVDARVLTDQEATRMNIIEGLDWLRRSATANDVAFLFASAHGVKDSAGDAYLFGHDADLDSVLATAVPWTDFQRVLGKMPGRTMMFMDTCYSGGFASGELTKGVANFTDVYEQLTQSGLVIWASSTGAEQSVERDEWENGAFTEALLDGLSGTEADADGDGILNELELSFYVGRRVRDLTNGAQHFVPFRPAIPDFPVFGVTGQ